MGSAFVSSTSELPDISMHNNSKVYQKGNKSQFFSGKRMSGNPKVAFLVKGMENAYRKMQVELYFYMHRPAWTSLIRTRVRNRARICMFYIFFSKIHWNKALES